MGQAWCKDKSTRAQDSKSPLDRVFVRCAHRIYPGLKEEGSVLGGATQRVTSSEIGYAGSPPRAALLRGRSIDSVDRPFHPSEWVDVNLEVPCTPRASVIFSGQRRSFPGGGLGGLGGLGVDLSKPNGERMHVGVKSPGVATPAAPVPPPRRRRRRERRPLPPKPGRDGGEAADDESEPEPLYSKLTTPTILVEGPGDSDEEFAAIELILQKHSLDDEVKERPKNNHSTTSLPNELLDTPRTPPEDAARRPPRHVKTGSLPRDASLFSSPPQTPERTFFARRIEEDHTEDNSISKLEEDECVLGFQTSTPVKAREQQQQQHQHQEQEQEQQPSPRPDNSESFKDESSESRVTSSASSSGSAGVVGVSLIQEPSRRDEEDRGYESRTNSNPFSDASVSRLIHGGDELSSGILRDAIVDPFEESANGHILVVPTVQRTISEESLPREMLVDELDEDDDQQPQTDEESSIKDTGDEVEIKANGIHDIDTPPLQSPVLKCKKLPSEGIGGQGSRAQSPPTRERTTTSAGAVNPATMTPSLMELEAALTVMLEKKDEREREEREEEDKSSGDKLSEPQIVPVKLAREESVEDHRRVSPRAVAVGAKEEGQDEVEGHQLSSTESRLIDFPRADRINPFNDLKSDDLEPPEKPNRLHRVNPMDESVIEEPVLVPTPPRRRPKSKSSLNLSTDSTEAYSTSYAVDDRLI